MFKQYKKKDTLLFLRNSCLKIMKTALKWYEQSGDEKWLEYAKSFGKISEDTKKEIDKL